MTDYRLRNNDLLYVHLGRPPIGWQSIAIFASIGFTVMLGVAAYLTGNFNPASTGFGPPAPALVAEQPAAPPTVVQLDTPPRTRSGS